MAELSQPLLADGTSQPCEKSATLRSCPVTDYVEAGVLSRLTFSWLHTLLDIGSRRILQKEDVPILGPHDRASSLYDRFSDKWSQERQPNSVRKALFKAFWREFVGCGFLGLGRVSLMYVGPVLIQSFVNVTAGNSRFKHGGQVLVAVLLLSQSTQILVNHQYQFYCNRLGMQIRSALITSLYRKGLRLSSSARQSHGLGQIVNYMSVDAKGMADVVLQLHNAWMLPMQITIAIAILVNVVKVATVAGLAVMLLAVSVTLLITYKQKLIQKSLMRGKDVRMKITNEVLAHIKVIKLQAYEERFLELVQAARASEYVQLAWRMYLSAVNIFILWMTPLLSSVAIFAACVFLDIKLTAATAFTTIATVRLMQEAMRVFPQTLIAISVAFISLDRIERFVWSDELEEGAVAKLPVTCEVAVTVEGGCFNWDSDSPASILSDISISIKRGSLVTVVGRVGSGKSSLLYCLLGEMSKMAGEVKVCGTTAYVSQAPWIQNATIQQNILFGLEMDYDRYKETVRICQLEADLAQLEFADQTEIGERGINLSGGQKQRIQLARAVYQDCDIYLLDDIFSAVDAHTGSKLFIECVLGKLKTKTVILVTHQVDFLHQAHHVLVMKEGKIAQSGVYSEIIVPGTELASLVDAYGTAVKEGVVKEGSPAEPHTALFPAPTDFNQHDTAHSDFPSPPSTPVETRDVSVGKHDTVNGALPIRLNLSATANGKGNTDLFRARLIDDEERASGRVSGSVYWLYMTKVWGGALILILVVVQTVWQGLQIAGDFWLAYMTGDADQYDTRSRRFISVYTVLALACGFCVLIRSSLVSFGGLKTSQDFYRDMLHSIFRAPLSFFDTTPTGRILSRASTDQSAVDTEVPLAYGSMLAMIFAMLGICVVTLTVTREVVIILLPLTWAYYFYQKYYLATARELTRIDGLTKAPIIHHFSETIAGLVTIRSYGQQGRFSQGNLDRVDNNLRFDFHNNAASEWMGVRTETLGCVVLCTSALVLVSLPPTVVQPELVGLCLSYGLSLNVCLYAVVWVLCYLETNMVSVERIRQFSALPSEAPLHIQDTKPPAEWPQVGTVVFRNLQLRYRASTPLVLKEISLTVQGGDKVGVVGRTGSGKSTLTLALFRLVEAAGGTVLIDGIDISSLGLHDLRKKLSIIPQEPTLFDGTIRTNLDILGLHTDDEIWECLRKCQLIDIVRQLDEKLDSRVLENGENWSVGQRQLFCLGRALLRRSRILVLDEATASVDAQTDNLIQKTVRDECNGCTVISIAHRIPTVMDSDKVLVLDAGRVREYDKPSRLLAQPASLFSSLVHEYAARARGEEEQS